MSNKKPLMNIDIDNLEKNLDDWLANKPAKYDSIQTLINRLKSRLIKARKEGVTYAELTEFLNSQNVKCSESTLKSYLRTKRETKSKKIRENTNANSEHKDAESSQS